MKSSAPLVFGFVLLLRLPAPARLVPLDRDRGQGDRAQPALGGRRLRRARRVFQWGWGENLLDFQSNGGIATWLPMFLFVILFGLSMDYHVFILSRIREAYDRGLSHRAGRRARASSSTAGVVTERRRRDGRRVRASSRCCRSST